jgi:hypothetical protein
MILKIVNYDPEFFLAEKMWRTVKIAHLLILNPFKG